MLTSILWDNSSGENLIVGGTLVESVNVMTLIVGVSFSAQRKQQPGIQ